MNTFWVRVSRSYECSKASIVRTVLRCTDFSGNVTLSDHTDGISPTCWSLTLSEVLFKIVSVGNLQFSTDVNDMDAHRFILLNMRIANRLRYLTWLTRSCIAWNGDHRIVVGDRATFLLLRMNEKILFLFDRLSSFLIIIECEQSMRHTKDLPKLYSLSFITSLIIRICFSSDLRQMFLIFVNLKRTRLDWDARWSTRELIRVPVELLIVVSLLSPFWRSFRSLFPPRLSSIIC